MDGGTDRQHRLLDFIRGTEYIEAECRTLSPHDWPSAVLLALPLLIISPVVHIIPNFLPRDTIMLTDDGKRSIIILTVLTVLSTVFLGLRLVRKRKLLGPDDWLLCFAVFLLYLQAAGAFLLAIKGGEGKQMSDLTPGELTWLLKMEYWPELGYTITIATIKISVLISYYWIFGRLKWFRYAVFTLAALISVWFFGVFFSVMFQCTPIDKAWQPMKPGHCIEIKPFLWGNSISNTVLDYLILLLPVVPVSNLQMGSVQKVLILLSFSLGSLASISSTLRAVQTKTVNETNISATIFKDSVWTYIEPNAGVLSACLPFLANVFGQRLIKALKLLSAFATRTTSFLRLRSRTDHKTKDTNTIECGTQRATHESYELTEGDNHGLPGFKDRDLSQESIRHLV